MSKKRPTQLTLIASAGDLVTPSRRRGVVAPGTPRPYWTLDDLAAHRIARMHKQGLRTKRLAGVYYRLCEHRFGDRVDGIGRGSQLGELALGELEPPHFYDFAWALLKEGLEPSTVRTLLGFAKGLLDDAVSPPDGSKGVLEKNPARLPRKSLPVVEEPDELAGASLILSVRDMSRMVKDERIPFERRLVWALLLFTGCRFSEAVALPWDHFRAPPETSKHGLSEILFEMGYDEREKMVVPFTKTRSKKHVPVHPVALAPLIHEALIWWRNTFGRAPESHEPIAAVLRRGRPEHRLESSMLTAWKRDLRMFGLPARSLHKARHTFISRLEDAGADMEVVRRFTHERRTKEKGSFGVYRWRDWPARERAILCLELDVADPQLELFT